MEEQKRSTKENAKAVAETIKEIDNVLKALSVIQSSFSFIKESYFNDVRDKIITDLCKKHSVKESNIRIIAKL